MGKVEDSSSPSAATDTPKLSSHLGSSRLSPGLSRTGASQTYMRDDTYYCDVVVILVRGRIADLCRRRLTILDFQVEGYLFKIPRFVLQESEIFQVMFSVPPPEDVVVDGSDDDHPLRLDGYLAQDFRQFLRVVLPT